LIEILEESYDLLSSQAYQIDSKYENASGLYMSRFKAIYKSEIDSLEDVKKRYSGMEDIVLKRYLGIDLVNQLDGLIEIYDELLLIDRQIEKQLPGFLSEYKSRYPIVYEKSIAAYKEMYDNYTKCGQSLRKLKLGDKLLATYNLHNPELAILAEKEKLLEQKNSEFKSTYIGMPDCKQIVKKFKTAYEDLSQLYNEEPVYSEKVLIINEIILLLRQTIALTKNPHGLLQLNEDLKGKKTTDEILRHLGVR
jgi:hypothetical protein